ncbi:hypothetical protein HID58_066975, partial [Brassica napus]
VLKSWRRCFAESVKSNICFSWRAYVASLVTGRASTSSGKGKNSNGEIKFGYSLVKGKANHPMEDYYVSKFTKIDGKELGLFAIYDGHLGERVPAYLQKHLFSNILKEEHFWFDPQRALIAAYEKTDQTILSHSDLGRGGSTAVTAILLNGRHLWVANVGDSRAVLSQGGQAIQMTIDHEPHTERLSIEDKGGFVSNMPGDVPRVNGQLAVSRAFGDKSLKTHLRSDPDVKDSSVDAHTDVLVLASDGLWKVMANQEAIDIARRIKDPLKAAKELTTEALRRDSKDDISCIVVRLRCAGEEEEERVCGGEEESCGGEEESCGGEEESCGGEEEERSREKKRDAAKKKTETAEKKRKQDSSSSESSSNPTKRRRTASSPEQHSDPDHSPAPSAELLSQDDREGTPSPSFPIEPQKAPTQTPSEAENPLQAPITSNNRKDPNRESHSPEAAINNEAQRTIGSNNSDSNPPEAAIGSATIDNDAPRMENMAVEPMRPVGFFFKPKKLEKMEADDGSDQRLKMAVISSTLKPQGDELDLLYEIMDEGSVEDVELQDDSDKADIAVDGWNRILIEPEGKIFWEDLFEMDVRNRPTTQQQSEPHGIFEGQEEERVGEEPEAGGEAGRESVKELELRLNKRMDDGFALRDETIRLLAARVKELEQDKIQRENWSFQFGEYETCEASGGKGRDNMGNGNEDGEAVAEKDGEKQVEEEAEKNGTKEAEKDGAKEAETTPEDAESEEEADKDGKNSESDASLQLYTLLFLLRQHLKGEEEAAKEAYEVAGNEDEVGQKEGETEADKEGETEEGKTDVEDSPSTLQVMAEAAEKLEKEVDDKAAAEKAADELAAADKAASDKEKVGDEEEIRPKRTHKPSRPLRSPYQKN